LIYHVILINTLSGKVMAGEGAYISTREAADLLGISLRTAQLWVEQGILLAWKTAGGHRRILLDSVESLLDERKKISLPKQLDGSNKTRIALVEDDSDLLKLLQMAITSSSNEAYDIQTASDGFKGLVMIGEFKPDILITDLNMPHMDGFRMLRAIQDSELSPKKIIVTTALNKYDIELRGGLAPNIHVLEKPYSFTLLSELLAL
jgi:excisionase family DNA binding protein